MLTLAAEVEDVSFQGISNIKVLVKLKFWPDVGTQRNVTLMCQISCDTSQYFSLDQSDDPTDRCLSHTTSLA